MVAWSVMARWYPARRRPGTGAARGSGRRRTSRSGPNGPAAGPGAAPAGSSPSPAYQAIVRALVESREGRGEAPLGRRFEDRQGHVAGSRRRPPPGSARRGRPTPGPRRTRRRRRPGAAASSAGRPVEVDRRPAERDEPGVRRRPARRPRGREPRGLDPLERRPGISTSSRSGAGSPTRANPARSYTPIATALSAKTPRYVHSLPAATASAGRDLRHEAAQAAAARPPGRADRGQVARALERRPPGCGGGDAVDADEVLGEPRMAERGDVLGLDHAVDRRHRRRTRR